MTPSIVVNGTSWWIALMSGLAGGIVGAGGALLAGRFTQNREDVRRRRSQMDIIRAAKAERLRDLYAPLAQAAEVLHGVMRAQIFVMEGDTLEERNERHDKAIADAFQSCRAVGGRLSVEPGTTGFNNAFNSLNNDFRSYFRLLRMQRESPTNSTLEKIAAAEESLDQKLQDLLEMARSQLAELEQPAT